MTARGSLAATLGPSAPVFAALGDPTRLRIVARLASGGSLSIAQLADGEPVTRQAIAKHLDVLSGAGLVVDRKQGRERLFALEPAPLDDARRRLAAVSERWDRALARLRTLVEEE